jgi:hypothetical protein
MLIQDAARPVRNDKVLRSFLPPAGHSFLIELTADIGITEHNFLNVPLAKLRHKHVITERFNSLLPLLDHKHYRKYQDAQQKQVQWAVPI